MVASQPWRLPKEKRRRKKGIRKTKEAIGDQTETSSTTKEVTEKTASSVPLVPTVNTQIDSDFVRVSASRYVFT